MLTFTFWVKAFTDFATAFLAGLAGMTLVFPSNDWKGWAVSTGIAIANVALNAFRRVFLTTKV